MCDNKERLHFFGTSLRGCAFFIGVIILKETVCCFFGHHDAKEEIMDNLRQQISSLIENENVSRFYVGNHGHFDYMVITILREMKEEFSHIDYRVVLAYMPKSTDNFCFVEPEETVFPNGLEKVPRRFGIVWRNKWMLKQSDIVVCYAYHHLGGAGQMVEMAEKQGKRIINIAKI